MRPIQWQLFLGSDHATVAKMVEQVNAELPAERQIYISLYNSPSNRILSSYRSSLLAFQEKYHEKISQKEIKFIYLQTTAPFHCPLMKPILELMSDEIQHIGFQIDAAQIKRPVFSFYDQKNYQELKSDDIPLRLCRDFMLHTMHWDKALQPAAHDDTVTHILDFGPAKTSQRLSVDTLAGMNVTKPVIALAIPKDQKTFRGA